ncbi:uncharacterized protein [Linepithema humile]|uniref:uncharacterized protein n=1 Tax=Linepithema humile TaxID=83485 RepID=UPI00351DED85
MSRFTIALFEDGLFLVPSSWLTQNNNMCYWPPYTIRKETIRKFEKQLLTKSVLIVAGLNSKFTAFLEHQADDISRKKRQVCHKPLIRKDCSSSDESDNNLCTDENQEAIVDKELRAIPPVPPPSLIANKTIKQHVSKIKEIENEKLFSCNNNITSTLDKDKNTLPEILRKLNQIFAKLSSIDNRLSKLEEKGCTHENKEILSVLQEFVSLPLKSNEELQNMEKDLEDKEFLEQMAISMNRIGGRNSHDLTINILKRVISNEVAPQYSWAGKLKKMGFKDLLLAKCIIRAVNMADNKVTEKETVNCISKWLVQATLRHERSLDKQKIKNQKTSANDQQE